MSAEFPTYDVLGVPVSVTTPEAMADAIERWSEDDIGRFVCIRDVASLMVIRDDPAISGLHARAAAVTPDGAPIALIGKRRGLPVERTCGPDLLELVCSRSPQSGLRHFFYGGKEGVAERLAEVMQQRFPGLEVAGWASPPFGDVPHEVDVQQTEMLRDSGADVVWVGMSSPRQDVWMSEHVDRLPQTLIGVGAAFDFHTGEVKRAPQFMRDNMLEWAYRLYSEPRRLWRRYLIQAPRFVMLVVRDAMRRRTR